MKNRIMVVDDDLEMRQALAEAIGRMGYSVDAYETAEDALMAVKERDYLLVITDMKMPGMDGVSFLRQVRQRAGNVPVIIITGYGTVESAVEAMKEGATDYLMKPFSFETLKRAIDSVSRRAPLNRQIITSNAEMNRILLLAESIARTDITVLITGESGTGKELLARYIHQRSNRANRPFVAINCAAIPESLLESELFGYEKGAFTGAVQTRRGKFEIAQGGTLLLDEIGEMPLQLQAKLLRVLQEKEIERLGSSRPIKIDVRIIATTNRDLKSECLEGRFREDLYYRLNVFPLNLPPLRQRQEDIPLLAEHFLEKFSQEAKKQIRGFTSKAMQCLLSNAWRGNVRELENVVQRAVLLCRGEYIDVGDLMLEREDLKTSSWGSIKEMERELILDALRRTNGNRTKAARILGISVRTLRNKLKEYGKNFHR